MQAARQRQAARRAFGHYFAFLSPTVLFGAAEPQHQRRAS